MMLESEKARRNEGGMKMLSERDKKDVEEWKHTIYEIRDETGWTTNEINLFLLYVELKRLNSTLEVMKWR